MQRILISGASVAGPVLAFWLERYGFEVTVIERTPSLRHGLGGHAVDLFSSAVDVAQRMGLWEQMQETQTQIQAMTLERTGKRPVEIDLGRLSAGISSRHVEILRGELTRLLYAATLSHTEYLFGDSIVTVDDGGAGVDVTFEQAGPRRFDLVIGADGMHSTVRRLVFGPEESMRRPLGGYLAVYSMPDEFQVGARMLTHLKVGQLASVYGVRQSGQARAAFIFRKPHELRYDYRDKDEQKRIVLKEYRDFGWKVPQLLAHLDAADDFYFDAITQITLDTWQRGRVGLVGDAGFCPGPAVGGGTSLAVVTAYVLAGELAAARRDLPAGLQNYERKVRQLVDRTRAIGPKVMKSIVPATPTAVRAIPIAVAAISRLPISLQRRIWAQNGVGKALDSMELPDYSGLEVRPTI